MVCKNLCALEESSLSIGRVDKLVGRPDYWAHVSSGHFQFNMLFTMKWVFNPSNDDATFVQSTRTQISLINILNLLCWYSLDSSR